MRLKILANQVRFVLWTGDDTVHCDDAYSDKNTVSGSKVVQILIIHYEAVNSVSRYVTKVIEIISSLSRQLNKTGLPVLPVQVAQYSNRKHSTRLAEGKP